MTMKTEKSNLIFSVLFFIWAVFYTAALWQSGEVKNFVPEFWVFCGAIIVATFFNSLAYKFRHCLFYLMGVFGFTLFALAHIGNILAQFYSLLYQSRYLEYEFPLIANCGIPLALYGVLSTLFCFQKTYNEKMEDENTRINFYMKSYTRCITIFYAAIIPPFIVFFYSWILKNEFDISMLSFLIPTVLSLVVLLAVCFKSMKLCIVAFIGWGLFVIFSLLLLWDIFYRIFYDRSYRDNYLGDVYIFGTIILAVITYIFVGIHSTLYLYRKYGNQNTAEMESTKNTKKFISKALFYLLESFKGFIYGVN